MTDGKINPFESFSAVYELLMWTGFCKLLNKTNNRFKWIYLYLYRPFVYIVVIGYHIPQITFIIQRRHNLDDVFDCTMVETPQIILFVKLLTFNLNTSRINKINMLINDPIFAAHTKKDEEMLLATSQKTHRYAKIIKIGTTLAALVWPASLFGKRYQNPTAIVPIYTPFETDTWTGYTYSVMMEVLPILWSGYGHLALDCLVATYYSQAEVQLKIIKYNLEHLFDTDDAVTDNCLHRDVVDKYLKNRFVHYVQRYEAVVWYTKEITGIFNISMSFQFFCGTASLGAVIYKMSSTPVISAPFAFLVVVVIVMLAQVFVYCYFGNLVQCESESVATSLYLSDWSSTSLQLRRLFLIAMLRWSQGISPIVCGVVPLSLPTFVTVLRSAYSLFAVLSTK